MQQQGLCFGCTFLDWLRHQVKSTRATEQQPHAGLSINQSINTFNSQLALHFFQTMSPCISTTPLVLNLWLPWLESIVMQNIAWCHGYDGMRVTCLLISLTHTQSGSRMLFTLTLTYNYITQVPKWHISLTTPSQDRNTLEYSVSQGIRPQ